MKISAKFIVSFVLLMLFFSMSGNAMNFFTCVSDCASSCQFSESSSAIYHHSSLNDHSLGYDSSSSLSVSDIELGFKSVRESTLNHYHFRRILEINNSLKDLIHKFFLLRENSLVLDQSKFYYSDKDPHYSIICSDYYVFALRRILI